MKCVPMNDGVALSTLAPSELDHVTFSVTATVEELAQPRMNYLIERAREAETEMIQVSRLVDGVEVGGTRNQASDDAVSLWEADSLHAGVTVDVSDVDTETVAFLMEASNRLESALMDAVADAKAKAGSSIED